MMSETGGTSAAGASVSAEAGGNLPPGGADPLTRNFSEMGAQLGEYLSRERRKAQAGVQKFLLAVGAALLGLLLMTLLLLLGWILVFYGATEALGEVLGGRTWLAALILGGALLSLALLAGLGFWIRTARRWERAQKRAKEAKETLRQSFRRTEASVKNLASLQVWTQRYPLQVTGVAMLAGFSLAGPLTARPAATNKGVSAVPPASPVFDRMQIWATLLNTGADILKDVLTPLLQEMVRPKRNL